MSHYQRDKHVHSKSSSSIDTLGQLISSPRRKSGSNSPTKKSFKTPIATTDSSITHHLEQKKSKHCSNDTTVIHTEGPSSESNMNSDGNSTGQKGSSNKWYERLSSPLRMKRKTAHVSVRHKPGTAEKKLVHPEVRKVAKKMVKKKKMETGYTSPTMRSPRGASRPISPRSYVAPKPLRLVKEWAHTIEGFSSEHYHPDMEEKECRRAKNLVGRRTIYPQHGSFCGTYAPSKESETYYQHIEVKFRFSIVITAVEIYEVYQPGSVTGIYIKNIDQDIWVPVYKGKTEACEEKARKFSPKLLHLEPIFASNFVRIEFCTKKHKFPHFDGIRVKGFHIDADAITNSPSPVLPILATDYLNLLIDSNKIDAPQDIKGDIVMDCGTYKLLLHQDILSVRCPFLLSMMSNHQKTIIFKTDANYLTMLSFMGYLYTEHLGLPVLFEPLQHLEENNETASMRQKYLEDMVLLARQFDLPRLEYIIKTIEPFIDTVSLDELSYFVSIAEYLRPSTIMSDLRSMYDGAQQRVDANVKFVFPEDEEFSEDGIAKIATGHLPHELYANRHVLIARCPYFRGKLLDPNYNASLKKVIENDKEYTIIRIKHNTFATFRALLQFIYAGYTKITEDNAIELYLASLHFLMGDQLPAPLNVIKQCVKENTAIDVFKLSFTFGWEEISQLCINTMLKYIINLYEHIRHEFKGQVIEENNSEQTMRSYLGKNSALLHFILNYCEYEKNKPYRQWAKKAQSTSYRSKHEPSKLVGKPKVYPLYGASKFTFSPDPDGHPGIQSVEIEFEKRMYATGIKVYETCNPGCIRKIYVLNTVTTYWDEVWVRDDDMEQDKIADNGEKSGTAKIFCPRFQFISHDYKSNIVKLELDENCKNYEIDAVQLLGWIPTLNN